MARISNSTTVSIASTASALAQLAATMPIGWSQLTSVSNQTSVLCDSDGLGTGSHIHFCNTMPWNPIGKWIDIIAMDHGAPDLRHFRYVEATNSFVLVSAGIGTGPAHGYDHNAVNPTTGDLYHRVYSAFTGTIQTRRKALGASSFTSLPNVAATDQNAIGTCWWSGPFVGGGAQGSFMIFNSGNSLNTANDGHILAYNPLTNSWFYNQIGKAPFYGFGQGFTYHSVMEYSPVKNVAVYGGGNEANRKLWRMDSTGSVLAMPTAPVIVGDGHQGILVNEPVSGNFLVLSQGQLWELNPDGTGTWTQQTGVRNPPSIVGVPNRGTIDPNGEGVLACSLPEHNVVAFITQTNASTGNFFLYKHA